MLDKQGRPYLKTTEIRDGMTIWLDGGFTCHEPGPAVIDFDRAWQPYFRCAMGRHYLAGQIGEGYCIGCYPTDPGPIEWQAQGDQE